MKTIRGTVAAHLYVSAQRLSVCVTLAVCGTSLCGCTTTKTSNTARTGTEQLLISNAIDQSLSKIDYSPMYGRKVLVEEKYLDSVDKGYVASTVRHHVLQAGGAIVSKPEEADVILEIRSGGIGTDTSDSFLGVPGITLPGMMTLPDVKVVTRTRQSAYAKIGLVAIDAKTHRALGDGGTSLSMSDDNNWYVMGVGPHREGSMKRELQSSIGGRGVDASFIPNSVAFVIPQILSPPETEPSIVELGSEEDEEALVIQEPVEETNQGIVKAADSKSEALKKSESKPGESKTTETKPPEAKPADPKQKETVSAVVP